MDRGEKDHSGRSGRAARAAVAGALFTLALFFPFPVPAEDSLPSGGFDTSSFGLYLVNRLAEDGFDRQEMEKLLLDRRGEILKTTIAYAIVYRETKADYSKFLSPDRMRRARKFLKRKKKVLDKAQALYRVPPEITAAILMIESDFGNFRKLHRTFNVFSTLIWANRPENFEAVRKIIYRRLPDVEAGKIRKRAGKKALWGYEQLKFLLKIAEREHIDPFLIEGSWAGAFGLPQFIPSSYWDYAVDGNGDGRVDLSDEDDAIFSIGHYLKSFGWKRELTAEKKRAVLRRYNNSGLYVDTVLNAAAGLTKR